MYFFECLHYMFGNTKHVNLNKTKKRFSANKLQVEDKTKVTFY